MGIRSRELEWFKKYLGNRTQRVKVNGTVSGQEWVRCGVPQGSTLGQLLFLIYINNIAKYLQCHTMLFVDDTVLYASDKDPKGAARKLQTSLDKLVLWTRGSQLTINEGKSKAILLKPNKKKLLDQPSLLMNGVELENVTSYKYLGVILDVNLNFKQHVNQIIRNVSHKIFVLGEK